MEKRHDNSLTRRLEEVADRGSAYINWYELYRWYGTKRIGRRTYQDLLGRWREVCEDNDADLYFADGCNGAFLIAVQGSYKLTAKAEAADEE